jgi:hypothetical protein
MLRPTVATRNTGAKVKNAETIQVIARMPTKSILVLGGMKWTP